MNKNNFYANNKRPIGLHTAASDYETLVQQATGKVRGFAQLYKYLERAITVIGKSKSTLTNYSRHLAHLALHYNQLPTELDQEQVLDYLHLIKAIGSPSATFFKFTVYGMRYACKMYVNYHDRKIKQPEENPTIGIILCKEENKAVVEFTLPENNKQIYAKEYKLYLPSKDDLKKQLE